MVSGEQRTLHRDQLKRGELAMFQDFYKQMRGEPLTQEQRDIITEVLESIDIEGLS
jgi:exonuclease SbcD